MSLGPCGRGCDVVGGERRAAPHLGSGPDRFGVGRLSLGRNHERQATARLFQPGAELLEHPDPLAHTPDAPGTFGGRRHLDHSGERLVAAARLGEDVGDDAGALRRREVAHVQVHQRPLILGCQVGFVHGSLLTPLDGT